MSKLYTESNEIYGVTISSDGSNINYIDPTEGPKEIPDITGHANSFLQVNSTETNIQWTDLSGGGSGIPINRVILGLGSSTDPSLTFTGDTDTGIYSQNANEITFTTNATQRLKIDNSSVDVGTALNNLNLNVIGNSSASNFRAGNGTIANPSYAFSTSGGNDTGMFYLFDTIDRLRFSAGGTNTLEMNNAQSFFNNRLLANAAGTNTTPALTFHNDSATTGYSGQRVSASTDPRLWAVVSGVQATELTPTQFNIGLTNSNNTNLKTLNQNGSSNFNTFTPTYTNIINTQITSTLTSGNWYNIDYNPTTGVYIAGSNGSGAGIVRIAVSAPNNLTSWTTYNDTTFALGNIRHVAYGPTPNIWVVGTGSSTTGNFYYSTDTINWTNVGTGAPFASARVYNRLKWINGQFIGLTNGSILVYSNNGTTWTSRVINGTSYTLQDIVYSSEISMYVITTTSGAVLYFNDTAGTGITASTTFTAQTTNVYASNAVSWSPKLSMFIIQNASVATQWASSSDGINWRTYTTTALNGVNSRIEWVPDFGGLFVACQAATNSNSIVSRDGLSWTQIPLTISGQTRGFYYNSSQKVYVFGLDGNLTFKNASTDFSNYIDSDNIYNSFNSNTRYIDTIEYQSQTITCVSGNNHFTPSQFNRSVVNFDTTATNANIYLQGASFNGKVGMRYRIRKEASTLYNVRIHGYETCRLITPYGEVASFNSQSTPLSYSIIPAGYYGSFELTRVNDTSNGLWVVDNVNVYDNSGNHREINNLSVAGDLSVVGTINLTGDLNYVGNPRMSSFEMRTVAVYDADINVPHFLGCYCDQLLGGGNIVITLKNLGVNGEGKTFYLFRTEGTTNPVQITNDSGIDALLQYWNNVNKAEAITPVINGGTYIVINSAGGVNVNYSWWKFIYMTINGSRRWIGKQLASCWDN